MAARRALVIGGSLGGLFAAHLLRSAGWDVVIFERNPEDLAGRGAGLSTHPQLIDILRRLGIDFDESMGVRLDTFIFLDQTGKTYLKAKTARTMSSWGRLYRAVRDPLPAAAARPARAARSRDGVEPAHGATVAAHTRAGAHRRSRAGLDLRPVRTDGRRPTFGLRQAKRLREAPLAIELPGPLAGP